MRQMTIANIKIISRKYSTTEWVQQRGEAIEREDLHFSQSEISLETNEVAKSDSENIDTWKCKCFTQV